MVVMKVSTSEMLERIVICPEKVDLLTKAPQRKNRQAAERDAHHCGIVDISSGVTWACHLPIYCGMYKDIELV